LAGFRFFGAGVQRIGHGEGGGQGLLGGDAHLRAGPRHGWPRVRGRWWCGCWRSRCV